MLLAPLEFLQQQKKGIQVLVIHLGNSKISDAEIAAIRLAVQGNSNIRVDFVLSRDFSIVGASDEAKELLRAELRKIFGDQVGQFYDSPVSAAAVLFPQSKLAATIGSVSLATSDIQAWSGLLPADLSNITLIKLLDISSDVDVAAQSENWQPYIKAGRVIDLGNGQIRLKGVQLDASQIQALSAHFMTSLKIAVQQ